MNAEEYESILNSIDEALNAFAQRENGASQSGQVYERLQALRKVVLEEKRNSAGAEAGRKAPELG